MSELDGARELPAFHSETPGADEIMGMCLRGMELTGFYAVSRPERAATFNLVFASMMADIMALATELDIAVNVTPTRPHGHVVEMTSREQWDAAEAPSNPLVADTLADEASKWLAELAQGDGGEQ